MAEIFVQALVVVIALVLWSFVVGLIAQSFGVSWRPFRFRRRGLQSLSYPQHVWFYGVLYWGCGMAIVTTLVDYIDWRYWGGSSRRLSVAMIALRAVFWLVTGVVFGRMTWHGKADLTS